MISDFRALAYLEFCQARNFFTRAVRQPGRVVMYLLVALYFGSMMFLRAQHVVGRYHGIAEPFASAIGFGAVALIALGFLSAARGNAGTFTSLADARFLVNSRLCERNVVAWLQIRSSWRAVSRSIFVVLLNAVIFPTDAKPLGMVLTMTAVLVLSTSLNVPLLRMRAAGYGALGQGIAIALLAGGVLCAAILAWPLLGHQPLALSQSLRALGVGIIVRASLNGNPLVLGVLWAAVFACLGLSYLGSTDLYPELLSASERTIRMEARLRRGLFARQSGEAKPQGGREIVVRDRGGAPPFTGARTILWKDWISFKRGRGSVALYGAMVVAAATGGVVVGTVAKLSGEGTDFSISIVATLGIVALMLFALSATVSLANDVNKPIWWVSASPLRARLYVWTASASWRPALAVTAFALAWALAIHNTALAAFSPLSIVAVFFVRSIGLALYALFPSRFDQRGPLAILRLFLVYVLAAVALGVGLAAGALSASPAAGVACGFLIAAIEAFALIEFSSVRIASNGASIAQAEGA